MAYEMQDSIKKSFKSHEKKELMAKRMKGSKSCQRCGKEGTSMCASCKKKENQ